MDVRECDRLCSRIPLPFPFPFPLGKVDVEGDLDECVGDSGREELVVEGGETGRLFKSYADADGSEGNILRLKWNWFRLDAFLSWPFCMFSST